MYRLLSYIKFYISATNQHGVHSPFVYSYVTQCLYKKSNFRLPISQKILLKSLLYFDFKTVRILGDSVSVRKNIQAYCPDINWNRDMNKAWYADESIDQFLEAEVPQMPNDAVLIINGIHKTKRENEKWERLKNETFVRVTVDLFYCGVVFFRKEQAKEHFKIRI